MEEQKTIMVLFTRYYSIISNCIYMISGRGYTHASIALEENSEYYYSFNAKGFRREYPKRHRRRSKSSICFKLEIPSEDYIRITRKIDEMESNKEQYHYTRFGVLCCIFHIPFYWKNHYFCSQFVAEILETVRTIRLKKKPALYFPNQLVYEIGKLGCVRETVYDSL